MRQSHGLPFIAPPFVWGLYRLAAHTPLMPVFGVWLMIADVLSIVAIPLILSRLFLGAGLARTALGAGFYFAAFLGAGVFTALVANNGTPLYALIALGLIPAVRRGRWLWFHLAVALATAFKPFYAAFWLVPLLADADARAQWKAGALAVAGAAAAYAIPWVVAPRLLAAWLHTLTTQTVGHERLGDNLLGAVIAEPISRHWPRAPYAAQFALSVVLLLEALLLGRLSRTQRIAALVLIAVFLNPRAMRYDLSTAAIPLLAVAAGAVSRGGSGAGVQAACAAVLAGAMILFSRDMTTDGFLYAGITAAVLLGAVIASRAPTPQSAV